MTPLSRRQIAWRAAQDLDDGLVVNLGIGIPTLTAGMLPAGREVIFQSENGLIGIGPPPAPGEEDEDLINASRELVTALPGTATAHHNDAFLMIRGGHIDVALLGGLQVSEKGDLANWTTGDVGTSGVGGAMDLAVGAREVRVLMEHTTKTGAARILKHCQYPLTAPGCVSRIYTSLAVIDVEPEGLVVREMVDGLDFEALQACTEAALTLADGWKTIHAPA